MGRHGQRVGARFPISAASKTVGPSHLLLVPFLNNYQDQIIKVDLLPVPLCSPYHDSRLSSSSLSPSSTIDGSIISRVLESCAEITTASSYEVTQIHNSELGHNLIGETWVLADRPKWNETCAPAAGLVDCGQKRVEARDDT